MKKRSALIFLGLILILMLLFLKPARNLFLFISTPFLNILEKAGSLIISKPANFFEAIASIKDLNLENERLHDEVRKLESEKADLIEQGKENEILKKQLGFVEESKDLNLLPAYIIGRAPNSFLQYLILNKGEKDGVKVGQTVISEGLLVGKIIEVSSSTSKVFLITNPTGAVPALTQETRGSGLAKGEVGYGLVLEDVPKDINIAQGENVLTSGLGGDYPKGLLIGKIEKIISSSADIFQKASLKILTDFSKLEIVFVIK